MPLTPEEQRELEVLKEAQSEATNRRAGVPPSEQSRPSPYSLEGIQSEPGLETPLLDPIDLLPVGSAVKLGSKAARGAAEAVTKPAGKLADWLAGRLSGTKAAEIAAYRKSPKAIEAIAEKYASNPAGLTEELGADIKKGVQALTEKNMALKQKLKSDLVGVKVPFDANQWAGTSLEPKIAEYAKELGIPPQNIANIREIPALKLQQWKEEAQDAANFAKRASLVDPVNYAAKNKAEAATAARLKSQLESLPGELGPMVTETNKDIARRMGYTKTASKMQATPESIAGPSLKSRSVAQVLQEEGGVPMVEKATQIRAAKSPLMNPEGPWQTAGSMGARAVLKSVPAATSAVEGAAGAAGGATGGLSSLILGKQAPLATPFQPESQSSGLTPEEEQELQELYRQRKR